ALRVVVVLYVVANSIISLGPCKEHATMNELFLQRRKEALGDCVVPAAAGSAHAALDAVLLQQLLVVATGILRATVSMMDQPARWFAKKDSLVQRCDGELAVE